MSKLSKHLEGKFEMVGVKPGKIRLRNGVLLDTTKATVKQADEAVKLGCSYLKKIEKTESKASGSSTEKKGK